MVAAQGHIEVGETAEQAAVREVEEETGIIGRVVAPLGTIDFWFVAEDRRVHKTVHHFLLRALGGELCDDDVEVAEVAWVPLGELESRLAYADERRLIRRATEAAGGQRVTRSATGATRPLAVPPSRLLALLVAPVLTVAFLLLTAHPRWLTALTVPRPRRVRAADPGAERG